MDPTETLTRIRAELKAALIERDELVDGALLALICGQHLLILGPPGSAKSMLARELCRRLGGRYFEWLLTKFSTPEELFGPVSLAALEAGSYERVTAHKLPEAEIAFLDEIFKANSAILNALLTLLNERRFYQGTGVMEAPLQTLIGASNELPEEEELAALYDRFLLRFTVGYIEQDQRFKALLALDDASPAPATVLGGEELEALRRQCASVRVSRGIIAELTELRRTLRAAGVQASDRRYRQALGVLRAAALLDGRERVEHRDLMWLEHVLWTEPQEQALVLDALAGLGAGLDEEARRLLRQAREVQAYAQRDWPTRAEADRALLEAHTKLGAIQRRLRTMHDEARERDRPADSIAQQLAALGDIQRALLESEGTWQS